MDIIIFTLLIGILIAFAALNKQHRLVGMTAGIGMMMLALVLQLTPLQYQSGYTSAVDANITTVTYLYSNVSAALPVFDTVLVYVIGAAGIFIMLWSILSVKA